jgi:hypothetical protein
VISIMWKEYNLFRIEILIIAIGMLGLIDYRVASSDCCELYSINSSNSSNRILDHNHSVLGEGMY